MNVKILHGSEWMQADENGNISRPAIKMAASGQWSIVGAVERNNFGSVVCHWSKQEVLTNPASIPWRFKNGKQRVFICDFDHGSVREWRCSHYLTKG